MNQRRILLGGPSVFQASILRGYASGFRLIDIPTRPETSVDCLRKLEAGDLLIVLHGQQISPDLVKVLRKGKIQTCLVLLDEPYETDRTKLWSRSYPVVFSNDRSTVSLHQTDRTRAFHYFHAYDEELYSPQGDRFESEILVLGSPYDARKSVLYPLLQEFGDRITWVGPGWRKFCERGIHVDRYQTPTQVAFWYRGAKVVINVHRNSTWSHFGKLNREEIAATHANPRCFEASACGTLVISSFRSDLQEVLPDMPVFHNSSQLRDILRFFLEDDLARKETIERILEEVKPHSYRARARQMWKILHAAPDDSSQHTLRDAEDAAVPDRHGRSRARGASG